MAQTLPEGWNREVRALATLITKLVNRAETIRDERAKLIKLATDAQKRQKKSAKGDKAALVDKRAGDLSTATAGWTRSEANLRTLRSDLQAFSARVTQVRDRLARSQGAEPTDEINAMLVKLGTESAKLSGIMSVINGQTMPSGKK